jgi:hypothetical protein
MTTAALELEPPTLAPTPLASLVRQAAADAMFAIAGGAEPSDLEAMAKRRGETYVAILKNQKVNSIAESFDAFYVEMVRVMAPVCPPFGLPMADVLDERVTLEIGARGLRGLFSSKPSEKDVQHVRRVGGFAARAMRAVLAADGPLDQEERRQVAAFVGALGLAEEDASPLYKEEPIPITQMEVYGDLEPALTKALMRGAWLAAAWDAIHPQEEDVVRTLGSKLGLAAAEVEVLRNEALARVDGRRAMGVACVDAARYMLSDRVPGFGVALAVSIGTLTLPRRYRDEALAHVSHWTTVQLSERYRNLTGSEKTRVLGLAWLCALYEDPTVSRRALLRARHDRLAHDLGEDGKRVRQPLEQWMSDVLAPAAYPMTATGDAK